MGDKAVLGVAVPRVFGAGDVPPVDVESIRLTDRYGSTFRFGRLYEGRVFLERLYRGVPASSLSWEFYAKAYGPLTEVLDGAL
ncbi:hypothetical protein GS498_20970 [Rhodococcus hoagii]|nr:hypothetical protein [Prescottella equi]